MLDEHQAGCGNENNPHPSQKSKPDRPAFGLVTTQNKVPINQSKFTKRTRSKTQNEKD
jgi:hypothetical protein